MDWEWVGITCLLTRHYRRYCMEHLEKVTLTTIAGDITTNSISNNIIN